MADNTLNTTMGGFVYKHLFIVILSICQSFVLCLNCTNDDFDLTTLNKFGEWTSAAEDGMHNFSIKISLCTELKPNGGGSMGCHSDTSVCLDYHNGTMLSAGNVSVHSIIEKKKEGDVWFLTVGDPCPENPTYNLTTSINFRCGPLIGSPKFLDYALCTTYLEWESHIFCKNSTVHDVPCYAYDDDGNRYDLSPLGKTRDAYLVSSEKDTEVYINVCRDINPVTMAQDCPSGVGGCRKNGHSVTPLGRPTEGLKIGSDKRLVLRYTSPPSPLPAGCKFPPSTTITFICPKRGGSKDPLITNDFDCNYVIEWETEYACPEATLSNSSCVLTKAAADIDIDLRPLTKPAGENYVVNFTDSRGTQYRFYMNVCGDLNIPCPDITNRSFIGACQTKVSDADFGQILGKSNRMELRYADNSLTLTYKGGNKCNHNNFQRMTEIEFICKQDADDNGRGSPMFKHEDDCRYYFEWETKYACLDHPVNEECRVNVAGKRYDLSSLVRTDNGNWLGLHDNNEEFGTGQYFINVCHDVLLELGARSCDPGAAICYKEILPGRQFGATRNLGRYQQNPVYDADSQTIQLKYINGDKCGDNQHISTTIYFICKPGELQSAPVLTHISNDKCFYDFEWHTAAACVLGKYSGTDCKVEDANAGFLFDLSTLKKSAGSFYKVSGAGPHDFLINVCGPLTGTNCDKLAGQTDVGICQVPSQGKPGSSYSAGKWSSKLLYFDGMINLTYTDGSLYHDDVQTPRKSEITFLCDPDAGIGSPKFLAEIASEHYYGFEWRTSFACPNKPMECTASDAESGQEYDLSKLTMGADNSNWIVTLPGENKKFYLNVCRALNPVHVKGGCNTYASACTTKVFDNGTEVVDVRDFGHIKSGILVEGEGRLKLVYEGQTCNSTSKYRTTIYFICRRDETFASLGIPVKNGSCEYSLIWNTASACPIRSLDTTEQCTIKSSITNYVYNLQPLRKQDGYTVQTKDGQFKLNICGNLSTTICGNAAYQVSVCQIKADGTKVSLAEDKYILEFNDDGRMAMTYEGMRLPNGDRVQVKIDFQCDQGKENKEPEFMRHEGDTYLFRFLTALACQPTEVDCMVQDNNGSVYDLGSLSKDSAWNAIDTRDSKTRYFINVCKPVNSVPGCPDEPIGGCQLASNNHWFNMGYIQSSPVARSDGSITMTYRNGDICHKDTPRQSHRSTRINFYCSDTEEGPVFVSETALCEYIFTWRTPAACSLQNAEGHDCRIVDPLYDYEFNLLPLRKNGSDYHVHVGEFDYIISLCGSLQEKSGSCDSSSEVGSCQTKPRDPNFTPLNMGKSNSILEYSEGELSLVYKDGHDGCQTVIKFSCDYSKDGTQGPLFIEQTVDCKHIFEWATKYACTPYKVGSCYLTDPKGHDYDLSSLTLFSDNYEVTDNYLGRKKFIINVCRSLIHKANATCPHNAAACMIDPLKPQTDSSKYTNLGEVNSQQVQFQNGRLVLVYTNGEQCGVGHMETYITFLCDQRAKETSPTGHFMVGNCSHHFVWSSAAACPLQKPGPGTGKGQQISCRTSNPATGMVYDLSRLKVPAGSKNWLVNDTSGHIFEFNVCGPLTGSKCANVSDLMDTSDEQFYFCRQKFQGVCQSELNGQKRTFNAGNSVNDVYFEDDGIVVLNYTGGDLCHNKQYQRNTIITFVCNNHNGLGRPVYLDEMADCTYYISWHTDLVCENEVKCTVTTDDFHTLDLSPLSRRPDNIVHSLTDGVLYYLSVCAPLMPVPGVMCPPGASACLVSAGSGKMHNSLGRPKSAPTYNKDTGSIDLIYTNGSQCDNDPTQNFTTKIVFTCMPGQAKQNPFFVNKAGCQYVFEWPTNVVCFNKEAEGPTDECVFQDFQSGMIYNFTALSNDNDDYTTKDYKNNKYYINPCRQVIKSGCGSSMVCREAGSRLTPFGLPKQYSFEKQDENTIKMAFTSGGVCPDGTSASSEILFKCNREAGTGQPKYFTGIGCQIQFIWETELVCSMIKQPCTLVNGGHLYDLTLLSKDNGAWNVSDSKGNSYWINICSGLNREDLQRYCGKNVGACRKSSYGYEMIGSVTAQKPLYYNNKTSAIVLEYEQGGNVCSHNKRRTDSKSAKTRINFMCGSNYGAPVFHESSANEMECLFEFTWKTKMACEVERKEVAAGNGSIFDEHSGGKFNLQPLLHKKFTYTENLPSGDTDEFELLLDGTSTQCVDGAICLIKAEGSRKVLGQFSSRKFYIDDEELEAVYTTNKQCTDIFSKMNITSIVQFHCNLKINGTGRPVLISRSKQCIYIFSWDTPVACLTAEVIQPSVIPNEKNTNGDSTGPNSSTQSKSGTKPKTVVTVIGVFLVVISLCILVVVFHRQERRAACIGGMRRLVSRQGSEYTQLPIATTDDFPVQEDIDEVLTVTDAAEIETSQEEEPFVHVQQKVYHDDSDEDLLL